MRTLTVSFRRWINSVVARHSGKSNRNRLLSWRGINLKARAHTLHHHPSTVMPESLRVGPCKHPKAQRPQAGHRYTPYKHRTVTPTISTSNSWQILLSMDTMNGIPRSMHIRGVSSHLNTKLRSVQSGQRLTDLKSGNVSPPLQSFPKRMLGIHLDQFIRSSGQSTRVQ